jgi:hypothetical protein
MLLGASSAARKGEGHVYDKSIIHWQDGEAHFLLLGHSFIANPSGCAKQQQQLRLPAGYWFSLRARRFYYVSSNGQG